VGLRVHIPAFMKRVLKPVLCIALCVVLATAAGTQNILPKAFAGWTQAGSPTVLQQAQQFDPAVAAVLNEYGFTGGETAAYTRADGRKLTVKAAQFKDATDAYGAFTFLRNTEMKTEEIGTKAASANERILFFRTNVVVDASFDRITGMSAAELRELAGMLPEAKGTVGNLPSLPEYLPKQGAVESSAKYILGPEALAGTKTQLPADLVNFNVEPEILAQSYTTKSGAVTLMLVQYPTPQIATERLRAFQAANQANRLAIRRTGPILVAETGNIEDDEAKTLLNTVNYEAEVTWNEATSVSKKDNIGNLILVIFTLIGVLLLFAIGFGVFFGGVRMLMTKFFPGTVLDLPENVEILQLHLDDHPSSK
jgi:hypothetical protein